MRAMHLFPAGHLCRTCFALLGVALGFSFFLTFFFLGGKFLFITSGEYFMHVAKEPQGHLFSLCVAPALLSNG